MLTSRPVPATSSRTAAATRSPAPASVRSPIVHGPRARALAPGVARGEPGGRPVREVDARARGVDECADAVGGGGAPVRHHLDALADRQAGAHVHGDLVRAGRRPAPHPGASASNAVEDQPVPRRPRVLGDGGDAATGVGQRGREADVADGRGDARQGGQPLDEPGRDRGPLGQRDRQVPARAELLAGGDHDVRAAEPPGRQLRTQSGLGEHAGGGDQRGAAQDRAGHGEQCGEPVCGGAQGEVQHGYPLSQRDEAVRQVRRRRVFQGLDHPAVGHHHGAVGAAAAAGSWVTMTTV
ncbi:hypothetical protein STENM223S_02528 [Streptomyces tendae]